MNRAVFAATVVLALAIPLVMGKQPRKSPDALDEWVPARVNVLKELYNNRDVIEWSNQLAGRLDKADRRTLFTALHVFVRSGHAQLVPKVVRRLCKQGLSSQDRQNISDFLSRRRLWASLRIVMDAYPAFRPCEFQTYRDHCWQTGDRDELEAWLAVRCKADWNTWHRDYYRVLGGNGRIVPLAKKIRREIIKNPTDYQPVRKYLAMVDMLPKEQSNIVWMGDVIRPKFAMDAFDLGRTLREKTHHTEAIKLFDHSLSRPITDYDKNSLRWRCSAMIPEDKKAGIIRRWTKAALALSCKEAGKLKRAQKLVEELVGPDGTLKDLDMLRFAGLIQGLSGQRVIEKRILKKEKEDKNSVRYWLGRAQYYIGRKEDKKAEEAFKKAIALPPDNHRLDAIRQYTLFISNKGRSAEAARLLREEIKRFGPGHGSAGCLVRWLVRLDRDRGVVISPDDPLLWQFLTEQKRYASTAEHVLQFLLGKSHARVKTKRALLVARKKAKAFWDKVLKLTGSETDPSRQKVIGEMLLQYGQPARALPLIKDALERWPKGVLNTRRRLAYDLFRIHLALNDWKSAEKIFFAEAHKRLTPREVPYQISRIAVVAARTDAKDDSMRLWKQRANLDMNNLDGMSEMVAAGMKDQLKEFYSSLAKRDPGNKAVAAALERLEKQ